MILCPATAFIPVAFIITMLDKGDLSLPGISPSISWQKIGNSPSISNFHLCITVQVLGRDRSLSTGVHVYTWLYEGECT